MYPTAWKISDNLQKQKIQTRVTMNYDADAHCNLQIISSSIHFNCSSMYRDIVIIFVFIHKRFVYIVMIYSEKYKKKKNSTKSSLVWGQTKWTAGEYVTSENLGTFAL